LAAGSRLPGGPRHHNKVCTALGLASILRLQAGRPSGLA